MAFWPTSGHFCIKQHGGKWKICSLWSFRAEDGSDWTKIDQMAAIFLKRCSSDIRSLSGGGPLALRSTDHGRGSRFLTNFFKTIGATEMFHIPLERLFQCGSIGVWNFSVALLVPEILGQIGRVEPQVGGLFKRAHRKKGCGIKTWLWRLNGWLFLAEKIVMWAECPHFGGYFEVKFSVRRTFIKWNGCQFLKFTS